MPVEAGVDETSRRVDQQPEAAEAGLAFNTPDQVVRHRDAFKGRTEDELAGVQHERLVADAVLVAGHLDQLGEPCHISLDVDHACGVVAEHTKQVRDPDVDRRWLNQRIVERVDDDAASVELFAETAVGQDHGATIPNRRTAAARATFRFMYNPPVNRLDDVAMIHELIERGRFAHVISHADDAFASSGLPLLLDRSTGEFGALRGHFARANDQWTALDGASVRALFPLTDGYVTPSRYPSKAEHHRVVPTWNYEVVHAHGTVRIHDDPAWVRRLVSDLTDHHETARHDLDVAPRWAVTDAPSDFIDKQLRAIVGIEIEITRLDGKRKLSQNRSDADRLEVIAGHATSPAERDRALAVAMREALD